MKEALIATVMQRDTRGHYPNCTEGKPPPAPRATATGAPSAGNPQSSGLREEVIVPLNSSPAVLGAVLKRKRVRKAQSLSKIAIDTMRTAIAADIEEDSGVTMGQISNSASKRRACHSKLD